MSKPAAKRHNRAREVAEATAVLFPRDPIVDPPAPAAAAGRGARAQARTQKPAEVPAPGPGPVEPTAPTSPAARAEAEKPPEKSPARNSPRLAAADAAQTAQTADDAAPAAKKPKLKAMKYSEKCATMLLSTATSLEYPKYYYKGAKLDGSYGKKTKAMEAIRQQLNLHPDWTDRVPRADVLDKWIDTAIETREKDKPDRDHTGDGDDADGNVGVHTESDFREAADGYRAMAKETLRKNRQDKQKLEAEESLGQVCLLYLLQACQHVFTCPHLRRTGVDEGSDERPQDQGG
jgi:hypothetical protein